MTTIPIHRNLTARRGWYRGQFHDQPDFTLLVPIKFAGHFTFSELCAIGEWKQLAYIPAPRRDEQRVRL